MEVTQSATGWASVWLTATDSHGMSSKSSLAIFFEPIQPPEAKIQYDENGDGLFTGPFSDGHLVSIGPGTVVLDGSKSSDNDSDGELTFRWELSGMEGASLSKQDEVKTELTIPRNKSGTITINLTATDPHGASASTSIKFQVIENYEPPKITGLLTPETVESGEEFEVTVNYQKGSGDGEPLFYWSATASNGLTVQVFSSGNKARMIAPGMKEKDKESVITVKIEMTDGTSWAEPVTQDVRLVHSGLKFAQIGVGEFDANRRIETAVVLVNSSDVAATGELEFHGGEEGSNWSVVVDGNANRNRQEFTIEPGEAHEYVLTGDGGFEIGWMSIQSNIKISGHVLHRVVSIPEGYLIDETPLLAAESGRVFKTALGKGSNDEVGLAIVNVSEGPMMFKVTATENGEGGLVLSSRNRTLQPGEQADGFLTDFLRFSLPDDFRGGTLGINVTGGKGKLIVLVVKQSEHGLPWTFLPIAVIE
jgi:hypothetical protein